MVRRRACATLLCGALLLAGCGDRALWTRWRTEREFWRAHQRAQHVQAMGRAASPHEIERAAHALLGVADGADPATGLAPGAPLAALQAARAGGQALLELGAMYTACGDAAGAERAYARAGREYAALPAVAIAAQSARITAAEDLERFEESLEARMQLAALDPYPEPGAKLPSPVVLAAPAQLARELRARGDLARADSVLAAAETRFATLAKQAHPEAAVELYAALGHVRAAAGDGAGALEALRASLANAPPPARVQRVLALAAGAIEANLPDSVAPYALWAASLDGSRGVAGRAYLLIGDAWEMRGRADSALAAYTVVLRRWPDPGVLGPQARFAHARVLEQLGRWEAARIEYRSIGATWPSHPLAFESVRIIVQHDLQRGEAELAQVTGRAELEKLARLQQTNRDPDVQRMAGSTQAELLLSLGRLAEAETTWTGLWRRFPQDSVAQAGALRAATLASHLPGGTARAARLYGQLGVRAHSAAVRRAAAAAAQGLAGREGR